MEKKLVVLDIDGTLTTSEKVISPRVKDAIERLLLAGHSCMLASGRPTPGLVYLADELNFHENGGYLLSYNGGKIINHQTGKVVFSKILDRKFLIPLQEFARKNGVGILTYSDSEVLNGGVMNKYSQIEAGLLRLPIVDRDFATIDFDVNKCLLTGEPEIAEKLCEELAKKYAGVLSIYRSEKFFVEIVPLGIDKAASLDMILPIIGFDKAHCIAMGDGYNDVSMIRYAGVGVAMGNAVAEVKAVADVIVSTNDEDGVAEAIDMLVLNAR